MTPGLQAAAARWELVGRDAPGPALVVRFVHRQSGQATRQLELSYAADRQQAELRREAGGPVVTRLTHPDEAADWRCDCPAGVQLPCLHRALAERGLLEEPLATSGTATAGQPAGDPPPLPEFACPQSASPGLQAAAARDRTPLRVEGADILVHQARVGRTAAGLTCDCPCRSQPTCLHRVLVDLWARGERVAARPAVTVAAGRGPQEQAAARVTRPAGERLPVEDGERFAPLLARVSALVAELVTFGLQRMPPATLERFDALLLAVRSVEVRSSAPPQAGLGRLVRALQTLRQHLTDFQARLVTTTELEVLAALGVVRNLVRALQANTGTLPLADFAGRTQQEYEPVGVLDVQGLGLEAWIAPTGYAGVTSYVCDLRSGQVLTRTEVLPREEAERREAQGWGNSRWAEQLAAKPAFTGVTVNYLKLAQGHHLLTGAQVAPDSGRLSGSSKTQLAARAAVPLEDPRLRQLVLEGAGDALRLARPLGFDALGRRPPSPPVALVPLGELEPPVFDRLHQQIRMQFRSRGGFPLAVRLDYREELALWFDNLERLARALEPPQALLCRLALGPAGLLAEPLTAWFAHGPCHLTYERLEVPLRAVAQSYLDEEEP